jgi:2-polyprenyl-3-methyl-5-hydroxy-6-metoxy-1,4-benzoquinol methylase
MSLTSRCSAAEIMDGENFTPPELEGNLADLARYNRLTGGVSAIRRALGEIAGQGRRSAPLLLLDVGAGAADIAAAIASRPLGGLPPRVLATDLRSAMLGHATRSRAPRVLLCAADAGRLPLPDGSVDAAWCSLLVHHLDDGEIVRALAEMKRVVRLGFTVSDLRRSALALASVWALTRLTSRNRITLHDGPLSVRRALTPGELEALALEAGLEPARPGGRGGFEARRRGAARLDLTWIRPGFRAPSRGSDPG